MKIPENFEEAQREADRRPVPATIGIMMGSAFESCAIMKRCALRAGALSEIIAMRKDFDSSEVLHDIFLQLLEAGEAYLKAHETLQKLVDKAEQNKPEKN